MKLVFASANRHKIEEIRALLPPQFTLYGLSDVGIKEEIPETGTTIRENSRLKASYVAKRISDKDLLVFADDSGLEVNALNGDPGVYSAHYAGLPRNDEANNRKLLDEMKTVTDRRARFVTVITLLKGSEPHSFEGEVKGSIAYEPRGSAGFGYDPLFIPQGYRSTFAELGPDVKNAISHRALAVKKLLDHLLGVS